jgi:hypothetical protein
MTGRAEREQWAAVRFQYLWYAGVTPRDFLSWYERISFGPDMPRLHGHMEILGNNFYYTTASVKPVNWQMDAVSSRR